MHDGDNLSDHSVLSSSLQLPVEYGVESSSNIRTPYVVWSKATSDQLQNYRNCLDNQLDRIHVSTEVLNYRDCSCRSHDAAIEVLHNGIVSACLQAGMLSIPQSSEQPRSNSIVGWNEHVEGQREKAIFWHSIWQQNGSPRDGVIADIRKRTRAAYHYAVRFAKKQSEGEYVGTDHAK